jgi:hypothetical protein
MLLLLVYVTRFLRYTYFDLSNLFDFITFHFPNFLAVAIKASIVVENLKLKKIPICHLAV